MNNFTCLLVFLNVPLVNVNAPLSLSICYLLWFLHSLSFFFFSRSFFVLWCIFVKLCRTDLYSSFSFLFVRVFDVFVLVFAATFFFLNCIFVGGRDTLFVLLLLDSVVKNFMKACLSGHFVFTFSGWKRKVIWFFFLVASFWVAGTPFFLFRECFQIVSLKCLSWHLFLALFRQVIYLKIGTFYGQLQCICVFSPQFEIQFFFCPNLALTWTEVSNVAKFRIQNENKNIWPSGTRYEYCVPYNWTDIKWGKGWCDISDKLLFLALFGQGGGFSYCCNDMISPKRDLQSQARLTLCFFFFFVPKHLVW